MMRNPAVSQEVGVSSTVIVLNYNGRHFLPDCLGSLEGNCPADCSVMVVDNGSTDGSLELLRTDFPWVRTLALNSNTGFAAGNNAGVRASDSDILILLNNDTRAAPDWIDKLLLPFRDPAVGAVTSSMRRFGEKHIMDSAGGSLDYLAFSADRGRGDRADKWRTAEEILFPCGGAMAVRRAALENPDRIFWEDLFIYSEDLDLGISLWRRGWKVVYQPDAVVEHHLSGTSGHASPLQDYYCNRNRIMVLRRHLSKRARRRLFPVLALWQVSVLLFLVLHGKFRRFYAMAAGTAAGLRVRVRPPLFTSGSEPGESALMRFMSYLEGTRYRHWISTQAKNSLARSLKG